MKAKLVLELYDVYGGDGIIRIETETSTKMKRSKRRIETRSDIGLPVSGEETEEESVEEMDRNIQTFRKDDKGRPVLRIGGPHGKLYGAFKDVAGMLKIIGEPPFTSSYKRIIGSIIAFPIWIPLEMNGEPMTTQELPQILAGMGNRMIVQKFDVISKCKIEIFLTFPDALKPAAEKLVHGLESTSLFNKRRATCKVLSFEAC